VSSIELDDIVVGARLRQIIPQKVDDLAESIKARGLLQPIVIRPKTDAGYPLIAGNHRLAALKKLRDAGEKLPDDMFRVQDMTETEAQLAEIDENLRRAELSPAEVAMHAARRKELYLKLNPKTGQGKAPGKKGGGKAKGAGVASFAVSAAEAQDKSKRQVQQEVARGEKLAAVLPDIIRTSLDRPGELDALMQMKEEDRTALVARAKAGENVSATKKPPKPKVKTETKTEPAPAGSVLVPPEKDEKAAREEARERWQIHLCGLTKATLDMFPDGKGTDYTQVWDITPDEDSKVEFLANTLTLLHRKHTQLKNGQAA
jgi:ParB-like chromosome segregation protein Spo0J